MSFRLLVVAVSLMAPALASTQDAVFLGKGVNGWQQLLGSSDAKVRRSAAFALGKFGKHGAAAAPSLKDLVARDADAKVREAAAFALGEIVLRSPAAAQEEGLAALLAGALTKDADPLVRRSAAYALGCLGPKAQEARQELEAALSAANAPAVRQNVAWALGRVGGDSTGALRKALKDDDPLVKRDALLALGELGPDIAFPAVSEIAGCVTDADVEIRRAAAAVLSKLAGPEDSEAAKPLQQALKDPDPEIRGNAALALSNIGGAEAAAALPVLTELLRKGDSATRRLAAAAFRNLGPSAQSAVPELITALQDKDAELRGHAALSLGGILVKADEAKDPAIAAAAETAVPALVGLLLLPKEPEDNRVQAAMALARIGAVPAAAAAIPQIAKILGDPGSPTKVRERVLFALRVHRVKLRDHPEVLKTFTQILLEPKHPSAPMLRYDCAYMLGVLQGANAPRETLDVLLEFLKDENIQIFTGQKVKVSGATLETGNGKVKGNEVGRGDGRVMAVQALAALGAEQVAGRPDIIQQLRVLAMDAKIDPDLRSKAKELLRDLGK